MKSILTLAAMMPSAMAVYFGCFKEASGVYALNGYNFADFGGGDPPTPGMTIERCETECTGRDFDLWGLENTGECRCGNSTQPFPSGSFQMFESDCQMACAGAPTEICGGWGFFSLYGTEDPPTLTLAIDPPKTAYVDEGCNSEGTGVRALSGAFHGSSALTTEACGSFCQSSGFLWFGTEYSSECYCGHALATSSTNETLSTPSGCSMACSGAPGEICGGPNRLSTYRWV